MSIESLIRARDALVCLALGCLLPTQTLAITIEIRDVGSPPLTTSERRAVERAAAQWEAHFDDPITIRVDLGWSDELPETVGARTRLAFVTHPYSAVRQALLDDANTREERDAAGLLPRGEIRVWTPSGDPDETRDFVTLSSANAKALGLGTGRDPRYPQPPEGRDVAIDMNRGRTDVFDYDATDGISPGLADFESLIAHEIGHALGFSTGIETQSNLADETIFPSVLDLRLFYLRDSHHDLGVHRRYFKQGPMEYDDGLLREIPMSFGTRVHDPHCDVPDARCQAGHWRDGGDAMMSPILRREQILRLRPTDLNAVDRIGFDRYVSLATTVVGTNWVVIRWLDFEGDLPQSDWPWEGWQAAQMGGAEEISWEPDQADSNPFEGGIWTVPLAVDFDLPLLGRGEAVGLFTLREQEPNRVEVFDLKPVESGFEMLGGGEPLEHLPHRLTEFVLAGRADACDFRFRATLSTGGAELDSTIGELGGFRIPGVIDCHSDGFGTQGDLDIDARIVLELALEAPIEFGDETARSLRLKWAPESRDSVVRAVDPEAFDFEPAF